MSQRVAGERDGVESIGFENSDVENSSFGNSGFENRDLENIPELNPAQSLRVVAVDAVSSHAKVVTVAIDSSDVTNAAT